MPGIVAVNLEKGLAFLDDGTAVPVTNMFDSDGQDTDDFTESASFVAGPGPGGQWWTERTSDYRWGAAVVN
jgi:hypothetical protein